MALRFRIGEEDSREFLVLFASLLDVSRLKASQLNKAFEVPPGALLTLRTRASPSLDDLTQSLQSLQAPQHWPHYLASRWAHLKGGVFWHALERGVSVAPGFGVSDGRELCRAVAAVAQTLLIDDLETRTHNDALARKYRPTPAPPQPKPEATAPVAPEPEPVVRVGQYIETGMLRLVHASHIGPASAGKTENQDATNAIAVGSSVVFALADGVSTSLGAKTAATTVVEQMCAALAGASVHTADAGELLAAAVDNARRSLDDVLAAFIAQPELATAGTDLPRTSAIRILENTRTGANRHLPAALNATLIAGIVRHTGAACEATLVRIGDGIAEHIRGEALNPVFGMDAETTQISAALGPCQPSPVPSDRTRVIRSLALQPGDRLVVSSDGLVRGHNGSVWDTIASFAANERWDAQTAPGILEQAAKAGDSARSADSGASLFDDNLSLVMIAIGAPAS